MMQFKFNAMEEEGMIKKVAKEAALAVPPASVSAGYLAGLTLQEWVWTLTVCYTILLILRALGLPVNKVLPQAYRCGRCLFLFRKCNGDCHQKETLCKP